MYTTIRADGMLQVGRCKRKEPCECQGLNELACCLIQFWQCKCMVPWVTLWDKVRYLTQTTITRQANAASNRNGKAEMHYFSQFWQKCAASYNTNNTNARCFRQYWQMYVASDSTDTTNVRCFSQYWQMYVASDYWHDKCTLLQPLLTNARYFRQYWQHKCTLLQAIVTRHVRCFRQYW